MFDSPMLEVAIGLVFVYLMLSLMATVLVETLTERRAWRGRMLYSKLQAMLGSDLVEAFYRDRRVADLCSGTAKPGADRWAQHQPGWLWRWFSPFPDISRRRAVAIAARVGARRLPSYIPESVFVDVISDWLSGASAAQIGPDGIRQDAALPDALAQLWDGMNRRAQGDPQRLRGELIDWFKHAAERMSGEFRRRARYALLVVGVIVVLATHADSLRMGQRLYQDPQLRAGYVQAAEQASRSCTTASAECDALRQHLNSALSQGLQSSSQGLLGWSNEALAELLPAEGDTVGRWLWTLLGWAMTVFAIGLGADFWFGALQKLIAIRNPKRVAAADESSRRRPPEPSAAASTRVLPDSVSALNIRDDQVRGMRGFDPLRAGESETQAFWLAQCALLAYIDETSLRHAGLIEQLGMTGLQVLSEGGTQCYVFNGPDRCIVAFRGTEQALDDVITDLDARAILPAGWNGLGSDARVHCGFSQALDRIWARLLPLLHTSQAPIWLTGHSLGGALATLTACRLSLDLQHRAIAPLTVAGVYTFGQPRVANAAFARACSLLLRQRLYRYVNASDVVPLVPPALGSGDYDYEHFGEVRYFDASGRLHRQRSLWERIAEQLSPALRAVVAGGSDWQSEARKHLAQRVDDHGMARYIECFERLPGVRQLWELRRT